jgi:hypothetical protein
MSSSISHINDASEPDEELSGSTLRELEQHISQRINRLSDDTLPLIAGQSDQDMEALETPFVPGFEAEPYVYPAIESGEFDYRRAYENIHNNYQGVSELVRCVHELSDLVQESILNLNVRLASIEQSIIDVSEVNQKDLADRVAQLQKAIGKGAPVGTAKDASGGNFAEEIQVQMKLLEEHINRSATEIRQKVDERQHQLREHVDIRAKVLEKMSTDNKDYLNRHFFSLAILFIIVVFISSALITGSVDRLSAYLTQQSDALHQQFEQLAQPLRNRKDAIDGVQR